MVQLASASPQLPPEISPHISQHAAQLTKLLALVVVVVLVLEVLMVLVLVLVLDAADLALVPHTQQRPTTHGQMTSNVTQPNSASWS